MSKGENASTCPCEWFVSLYVCVCRNVLVRKHDATKGIDWSNFLHQSGVPRCPLRAWPAEHNTAWRPQHTKIAKKAKKTDKYILARNTLSKTLLRYDKITLECYEIAFNHRSCEGQSVIHINGECMVALEDGHWENRGAWSPAAMGSFREKWNRNTKARLIF